MNNIRECQEDYKDIVEKFGIDVLEDRLEVLCSEAETFITKMGYEGKVTINRVVMLHTVLDYFSDIARIKDFHNIEHANETKIVAYEVQWLAKRKPLQIVAQEEDLSFVNEQFAYSHLVEYLLHSSGEKADLKKIGFFLELLYYYLRYRIVNAQALELALVAFEAGKAV